MRTSLELVSEIVEDECPKGCDGYCILKEVLMHAGMEPRVLMQLKCIEKFKYEESERQNRDIGWSEASLLWITQGCAEKFAEIYDEDMKTSEIYNKMFGRL